MSLLDQVLTGGPAAGTMEPPPPREQAGETAPPVAQPISGARRYKFRSNYRELNGLEEDLAGLTPQNFPDFAERILQKIATKRGQPVKDEGIVRAVHDHLRIEAIRRSGQPVFWSVTVSPGKVMPGGWKVAKPEEVEAADQLAKGNPVVREASLNARGLTGAFVNEKEYYGQQQSRSMGALQTFGTAGTQALMQPGQALVGLVAPERVARFREETREAGFTPQPGTAATLGELAGGAIALGTTAAIPGSTALFAAQGAGEARVGAAEQRLQGQEVSGLHETGSALLNAALMAFMPKLLRGGGAMVKGVAGKLAVAGGKEGAGALTKGAGAIGEWIAKIGSSPALQKSFQESLKGGKKAATAWLVEFAKSAGLQGTDMALFGAASTAINNLYEGRPAAEGVGESALQMGLLGLVLSPMSRLRKPGAPPAAGKAEPSRPKPSGEMRAKIEEAIDAEVQGGNQTFVSLGPKQRTELVNRLENHMNAGGEFTPEAVGEMVEIVTGKRPVDIGAGTAKTGTAEIPVSLRSKETGISEPDAQRIRDAASTIEQSRSEWVRDVDPKTGKIVETVRPGKPVTVEDVATYTGIDPKLIHDVLAGKVTGEAAPPAGPTTPPGGAAPAPAAAGEGQPLITPGKALIVNEAGKQMDAKVVKNVAGEGFIVLTRKPGGKGRWGLSATLKTEGEAKGWVNDRLQGAGKAPGRLVQPAGPAAEAGKAPKPAVEPAAELKALLDFSSRLSKKTVQPAPEETLLPEEVAALKFARARGIQAVFLDGHKGGGVRLGNTIGIASGTAAGGKRMVWDVVAHEIAHVTGVDDVLARLGNRRIITDAMQRYLKFHSDTFGKEHPRTKELQADPAKLRREGAALLIGEAFQDAKVRRRVAAEAPTLWQRVVDYGRQLLGMKEQPLDPFTESVIREFTEGKAAEKKAPGKKAAPKAAEVVTLPVKVEGKAAPKAKAAETVTLPVTAKPSWKEWIEAKGFVPYTVIGLHHPQYEALSKEYQALGKKPAGAVQPPTALTSPTPEPKKAPGKKPPVLEEQIAEEERLAKARGRQPAVPDRGEEQLERSLAAMSDDGLHEFIAGKKAKMDSGVLDETQKAAAQRTIDIAGRVLAAREAPSPGARYPAGAFKERPPLGMPPAEEGPPSEAAEWGAGEPSKRLAPARKPGAGPAAERKAAAEAETRAKAEADAAELARQRQETAAAETKRKAEEGAAEETARGYVGREGTRASPKAEGLFADVMAGTVTDAQAKELFARQPELVKRAKQGDADAEVELIAAQVPWIRKLAGNLARDPQQRQDMEVAGLEAVASWMRNTKTRKPADISEGEWVVLQGIPQLQRLAPGRKISSALLMPVKTAMQRARRLPPGKGLKEAWRPKLATSEWELDAEGNLVRRTDEAATLGRPAVVSLEEGRPEAKTAFEQRVEEGTPLERRASTEAAREKFGLEPVAKGPTPEMRAELDDLIDIARKNKGKTDNELVRLLTQATGQTINPEAIPALRAAAEGEFNLAPERPRKEEPRWRRLLADLMPEREPEGFVRAAQTYADLAATLNAGIRGVREAYDDAAKVAAPQTRGILAQLGAGIIRHNNAIRAIDDTRTHEALRGVKRDFDRLSEAEHLDFMGRMESGRQQKTPELQGTADVLRRLLDETWAEVQTASGGKIQTVIDDYFPHYWKQGAQDPAGVTAKVFGKRPLHGPVSFGHKRFYQSIAAGRAAGLELVTTNPVELAMMKLAEERRYIMGQDIVGEFKTAGLLKFVRGLRSPEPGWATIDDKFATVHGLSAANESVIRGRWMAPEPAAKVLNNFVSKGLRGRAWYDAWAGAGNTLNQAQLSTSAFHATFTTVDSMVSSTAHGLYLLSQGRPVEGIRSILQTPIAPILNVYRGNALLRELITPGSATYMRPIADALLEAGGRARMEGIYKNNAYEKLLSAWHKGQPIKAAWQVIPATFEMMSKPIMEVLVPRMKLGMFASMAADELKLMGAKASVAERRARLGRLWDSVDNRMGQMVYDNLFWDRTFKDLLQVSVRSTGWNVGTFREFLGGGADILHGRITPRATYLVAYPIVTGMIGAILNYAMTGEGPRELKDYWMPRTGKKDDDGNDERVQVASYMKDFWAYAQDVGHVGRKPSEALRTIGHKAHPLLSAGTELLRNEDFYGRQVFNPDDPMNVRAGQVAEWVGKQFLPFSVRNVLEEQRRGQPAGVQSLSFLGVTPAPRAYVKSEAVQRMDEYLGERGRPWTTPEQGQVSDVRRKVIIGLRKKTLTTGQAQNMMAEVGASPAQWKRAASDAAQDPRIEKFTRLSAEQAERVYALGTDAEKAMWLPYLIRKRAQEAAVLLPVGEE